MNKLSIVKENCVCLRYFLMPHIQKLFEDNHLILDGIEYIEHIEASSVRQYIRLDTFMCYISSIGNREKTLNLVSDMYKLVSDNLTNVDNMFIIVGINKNTKKTDIIIGDIKDEKYIHELIKDCNEYYIRYKSNLETMSINKFFV
jgi:hypothetical protein